MAGVTKRRTEMVAQAHSRILITSNKTTLTGSKAKQGIKNQTHGVNTNVFT